MYHRHPKNGVGELGGEKGETLPGASLARQRSLCVSHAMQTAGSTRGKLHAACYMMINSFTHGFPPMQVPQDWPVVT